jgi:hypothetical protein
MNGQVRHGAFAREGTPAPRSCHHALFFLLILTILFSGGCQAMHQTTTDQPSWPVTLYPVGRFLFPVPKGLDFLGRSIKINDMFIEEIDWGEGDHSQQFRDLWMPVHDKAKEHYDRYVEWPVTRGGFAYKDVSDLFGHPSVMLCYAGSGDHKIDTFIALPDFILRIKQECATTSGKNAWTWKEPP